METSISPMKGKTTVESLIFSIKKVLEEENVEKAMNNPTYEAGILGLSLFHCYFAQFTSDPESFGVAEAYLMKALAMLRTDTYRKLYKTDSQDNHLSNVGRYLEFCKKCQYLDADTNELLKQVDETLAGLMLTKASIGDFDQASGALAAGYYFLSRLPSDPSLRENLAILAGEISKSACRDAEGDYYWKCPSIKNRVFLGISHGSAMIISFLANVYEEDIARKEIGEILPRAVNFLLKQKTSRPFGLFPLIFDDYLDATQFSLCYGDLGVGYSLLKASRILNDPGLAAVTGEVLDDCLRRRQEDGYTGDASIVYGASGLAATFEKIYHITGDHHFDKAAGYWYDCIPRYAIHNNSYAGFQSITPGGNILWNSSFGWGITGIGISLMRQQDPALPGLHDLLMIA